MMDKYTVSHTLPMRMVRKSKLIYYSFRFKFIKMHIWWPKILTFDTFNTHRFPTTRGSLTHTTSNPTSDPESSWILSHTPCHDRATRKKVLNEKWTVYCFDFTPCFVFALFSDGNSEKKTFFVIILLLCQIELKNCFWFVLKCYLIDIILYYYDYCSPIKKNDEVWNNQNMSPF